MKAVTLRNFPPEVARRIQKEAKAKGISMNKAVIGLLEEHLGTARSERNRRHHDLDHLFGNWAAEQYAEFNKSLAEQREVDPEMWGRA